MLDKTPNGNVSALLNALDEALSASDVDRAVDLFQVDCYWRDLVTFTWNIKTMEGRDQVRDMLKAQLADTKPSNWKIADGEDATETDGVTESWIQFETAVARGFGHMRMKDGRIWTLLTTMAELKGHEEAQGFERPHGREARCRSRTQDLEGGAREGSRRARPHASALLRDHRRRAGRHRARRADAAARRADHHHREERTARRQLAQALQVALPA